MTFGWAVNQDLAGTNLGKRCRLLPAVFSSSPPRSTVGFYWNVPRREALKNVRTPARKGGELHTNYQ